MVLFVEQGMRIPLLPSVLESGINEAVKHLRSRLAHEQEPLGADHQERPGGPHAPLDLYQHVTTRRQSLAVRAPCYALNRSVMAAQGQQLLAAGGIPHPGRIVKTPCRQPLAVRAPGHAQNRTASGKVNSCCPLAASQTLAV
jgi:hypothetical protein